MKLFVNIYVVQIFASRLNQRALPKWYEWHSVNEVDIFLMPFNTATSSRILKYTVFVQPIAK